MKREDAFYYRHFDDLSRDLITGNNSFSLADIKTEQIITEMNTISQKPADAQKTEQNMKRT
jgi:hypothetical protein